jgi:8-oxo-dGTP diphosphatase
MADGRSLWLEVLSAQDTELTGGFDRCFAGGSRPAWEGVAVLCRQDDGALLMVLQAGTGEAPSWAAPGGGIEPGETPEQAAVRETSEETGLAIGGLCPQFKVCGVYQTSGDSFTYHIYYFAAEVIDGLLSPADPDGHILRAEWVEPARLCDLRFSHEDQRQILRRYADAPC